MSYIEATLCTGTPTCVIYSVNSLNVQYMNKRVEQLVCALQILSKISSKLSIPKHQNTGALNRVGRSPIRPWY